MKDHPYVGISHSYLKICKLRGGNAPQRLGYPGGWDRGIMGHNKATYLKGRREKGRRKREKDKGGKSFLEMQNS